MRTVPGHEFSGVITAIGKDVQDFEVGDEVYGMNDWFADGATAEFCITRKGDEMGNRKTPVHRQPPLGGLHDFHAGIGVVTGRSSDLQA
jgi:NADPH:quinone reductase-like Zn-dependent oxidoreductase